MKTKTTVLLLTSVILCAARAHAGSAAWNLNPTSSDWNTAANWTPTTVPNGPADTASFATSTVTTLSVSQDVEVDSIVFAAGADDFTITNKAGVMLTISGTGVSNSSGLAQNFVNLDSATDL